MELTQLNQLRNDVIKVLNQFQNDVSPLINQGTCDTMQWLMHGLINQVVFQFQKAEESQKQKAEMQPKVMNKQYVNREDNG